MTPIFHLVKWKKVFNYFPIYEYVLAVWNLLGETALNKVKAW